MFTHGNNASGRRLLSSVLKPEPSLKALRSEQVSGSTHDESAEIEDIPLHRPQKKSLFGRGKASQESAIKVETGKTQVLSAMKTNERPATSSGTDAPLPSESVDISSFGSESLDRSTKVPNDVSKSNHKRESSNQEDFKVSEAVAMPILSGYVHERLIDCNCAHTVAVLRGRID